MKLAERARRVAAALAAPAAGMAVLAVAVAILVAAPRVKARLLDIAYDTLERVEPRRYVPAPVRVVDIDEESLARLGQWPWPRSRIAELVERLRERGAAVVAFDMVFGEPDRTGPAELAKLWPEKPAFRALANDLPDPDKQLAEAMRRGSVVTAFALHDRPGGQPLIRPRFVVSGERPEPYLHRLDGAATTLPVLEAAAAGNGAINFVPDGDGIVRRVPLVYVLGEKTFVPALAAEALRVAQGAPNMLLRARNPEAAGRFGVEPGLNTVVIGRLPVPTDHHGRVWLHFTRPAPERTIPAWRVLEPDAAPDGLKDAIVFVGTSAQGLRDLRLSPLGVMPGVEAHAQLIEQVMTGSFLDRPDPAWGLELTGLVLAALVVVAIVAWLGPGVAAAATAILVAAALGGAWYAFHAHRMLLEPLGPAAALGAVFLAASLVQYVRSARQERWIRQAFSSYISPNLVEHLIDHPERLRLGGERRDCSFVLTDLAGFTAVVERSDPEALVGLMNEYLDGMVGIAFRHEGTLDRIVGDAVAVMFSAPLEQPDHAQRAIACALEMDAFARGFRRAKNEEGVPLGRTRIGVHSGSVIVGNFGGQHAFDYRALGDAINTTARLETVNRHLGTRICVSAAAVERCPGFIGRPVGRLVLKGKSEPILAYEPLSADAAASPRIAEYLTAYGLLEAGDPDAAQAFDALAAHYPDDRLALFHRDRLARGERGAEIVMEAK